MWQFIQVPRRDGYGNIPGKWTDYSGDFPLWRLCFVIQNYFRQKFENEMLLLMGTVNNKIHYKKKFSTKYEIEAKEKLVKMIEMFYDDGNYGKCYRSMIYAWGDLGRLYFETGDKANALKYLEKCATQAVKHDGMPE